MAKKKKDEELLAAANLDSLPPAGGQYTVPSVQEFLGILNSVTKTYRNPDEAVRDSRINARTMRRSPVIMGPLQSRMMATAELAWHLEPEDNKDKAQLKVAKELTRIVQGIPDFMQFKMWLLEAIFFGRSANQIKYRWDFDTGIRRLVVDSWSPVHGDSLIYGWGHPGQVGVMCFTGNFGSGTKDLSYRAKPSGDIARYVELTPNEREAWVIHKHAVQAGDFQEPWAAGSVNGVGLRNWLYWPWHLMNEGLGWLTEYMERVGLGVWLYRFMAGNAQAERAVREAAEAQSFSCRIIWPGYPDQKFKDIELIEPNAGGMEFLLRIVQDYYGGQITRMILGQQSSSGETSKYTGNEEASFQEDTFERIVKYDASNLEETFNRDLIPVLMKYNYPDCPFKIKFTFNVDKPDPAQFLQAAREFYNMGGSVDEDELREMIGLSKPNKDSSVLRRTMTELEMGALQPTSTSNEIEGKQDGKGDSNEKAEGQSGATATKIDAIKKAVNQLGVNARADDIMSHLQSSGLKVSQSLVYGVLHDIRGVSTGAGDR